MNLLLRRIRAFIIRDFQLALSYRVEFFIKIIWILGISTTFFFISRISANPFYPLMMERIEAGIKQPTGAIKSSKTIMSV